MGFRTMKQIIIFNFALETPKWLVRFILYCVNNSSDDNFIEAGLGGMDYSHRSYKKIISNLLKVDSKPKFLKNKNFTSFNVSKCPYGS
jgi:hypothetical protein